MNWHFVTRSLDIGLRGSYTRNQYLNFLSKGRGLFLSDPRC